MRDAGSTVMEEVRRRLLARAYLYRDGESYCAGVVVALEAMERAAAPDGQTLCSS